MTDPVIPREIRTIFRGRIFTVQVETIPLPHGGELEAEIIRHPGSVVIIPQDDSGGIILVRQYRHAIGRHAWELPAGSLRPHEDVEHAALRECQEETGTIPGAIAQLGSFFPTPGYCDERMTFFHATRLRTPGREDPPAHQDEDEDIEARAFSREEIRSMIAGGAIIDLKTVAGVALLDRDRTGPEAGPRTGAR